MLATAAAAGTRAKLLVVVPHLVARANARRGIGAGDEDFAVSALSAVVLASSICFLYSSVKHMESCQARIPRRERERERDTPVETIVEDVIPDQHFVDGNVAVADEKAGSKKAVAAAVAVNPVALLNGVGRRGVDAVDYVIGAADGQGVGDSGQSDSGEDGELHFDGGEKVIFFAC